MVNAVGMGFVMLEVYYGLGRHRAYLPADHYEGFLKYNFLDWNQVFITLALSKIAICLFLLRISKFEKWRKFLFGLIAMIIITHTPLTILFLLQCTPLNKNWDIAVPGRCFNKHAVEDIIIIQGVISIATDFIGAAFPILLLWNAKLHMRTKIALNLLMGLGVVTGTVCIVRTSYSWEVLSDDETWVGIGNALTRMYVFITAYVSGLLANALCSLEVNFGIIGACAPIMRPLYIYLRTRFFPPKARESLDSDQTPPSKLEWYSPPTSTPWYKRIFHAPAPTDKPDGIPEITQDNLPEPRARQRWSRPLDRGRDRPENATWAKDTEPEMNDSFDLPLQGTRKSEGSEDGDKEVEAEEPDVFGTYRYNRGWV